jgi:hypothetical protein
MEKIFEKGQQMEDQLERQRVHLLFKKQDHKAFRVIADRYVQDKHSWLTSLSDVERMTYCQWKTQKYDPFGSLSPCLVQLCGMKVDERNMAEFLAKCQSCVTSLSIEIFDDYAHLLREMETKCLSIYMIKDFVEYMYLP